MIMVSSWMMITILLFPNVVFVKNIHFMHACPSVYLFLTFPGHGCHVDLLFVKVATTKGVISRRKGYAVGMNMN
jgi:hypothetical protein